MPGSGVRLAEDDAAIAGCFAVMRQLRPHLTDAADFVTRVRRQQVDGYRLAYLEGDGAVVACAGYRVYEMLIRGRCLYVDDLVTDEHERRRGHGKVLLDWLADEARRQGCDRLDLDSGVQLAQAHRFYFREGLTVTAFHFARPLQPAP